MEWLVNIKPSRKIIPFLLSALHWPAVIAGGDEDPSEEQRWMPQRRKHGNAPSSIDGNSILLVAQVEPRSHSRSLFHSHILYSTLRQVLLASPTKRVWNQTALHHLRSSYTPVHKYLCPGLLQQPHAPNISTPDCFPHGSWNDPWKIKIRSHSPSAQSSVTCHLTEEQIRVLYCGWHGNS